VSESDLDESTRVGFGEYVAGVLYQTLQAGALLSTAVDQLCDAVALTPLLILEVGEEELAFHLELVDKAVTLLVDN